ncbi:MAG TPA: phospho-sugar mutase [Virgibacillus sp.]|nr:phospho-sugar mutase [Virgibacillus sp.]
MSTWKQAYNQWNTYENLDTSLKESLDQMKETEIKEAFYQQLTFGTGGMRGILGPGTNRMNIYTVRKAVCGLAHYLLKNYTDAKDRGVVVAYDSRHMSKEFALECAKVLGYNGIKTYVFPSLRPTPLLSFAVRYLQTVAGIMITASHNPPQYNGFKVYNKDGGQMTLEESDDVIEAVKKITNELTIPVLDKEALEAKDLLHWVGDDVDQAYLKRLKDMSKLDESAKRANKDLSIVFTPLHGTAHHLVTAGLKQLRFTNVHVVEEQAAPDPEFSTVVSPNPEEKAAFELAIALGREKDAHILLGTDPDADRLGVAVRDTNGDYQVLSGNQLGSLLLDYILKHSDPKTLTHARMLKTIVTTELGRKIAKSYGVETVDTLTGFKFISEKIRQYDMTGERFVFGYEESYGYLIESFSRDKDAVQAAVMASEMAYYWQQQGKTLIDALEILYAKHGYYLEGMSQLTLEGIEGANQIQAIMSHVREQPMLEIGGLQVLYVEDYLTRDRTHMKLQTKESIQLPQENVIKFILEDNNWVCLRPSGTEPKIKCYYGACSATSETSERILKALQETMESVMEQVVQPQ